MRRNRWDLFCRVVDNHGDIGVCWRLAADLASRGHAVRLWVDDASALTWMAPQGHPGVQVLDWHTPPLAPPEHVGDVVIEAFGCDPPAAFVEAMCRSTVPPVWLNLEYLSAEDYVARSHGLPSPAAGARGLPKWFYYPGFDRRTGGLLREPGLMEAQNNFEPDTWLSGHGITRRPGERLISIFCYPPGPPEPWLDAWSAQPTLLLLAPGPASTAFRGRPASESLRTIELPWLTQADYDRLLWSCDLNIVRGEDSFVRAIWAGAPFLWHIYPQHDGVHALKLEAFLERFLAGVAPALAGGVRRTMRQWNGLAAGPLDLPDLKAWGAHCLRWRDNLAEASDLVTSLIRLCTEKQQPRC